MKFTEAVAAASRRLSDFREMREAGLLSLDGGFFPSVHYPPITMYPPATPAAVYDGYECPADRLFTLYLHVPFCKSYCAFCHYPNRIGASATEKERYLQTLLREVELGLLTLRLDRLPVRSALIGGGTPTHLSPEQLDRFLDGLCGRTDFSSCTQFSVDVDPVTLLGSEGEERLSILRSHGVGRLTLGLQSLDEGILQRMNRHHGVRQAVEAVRAVIKAGFRTCIEFIFGYPGETLESWAGTLLRAAELGSDEIQLYQLKVVPYGDHNGRILREYESPKGDFVSPETTVVMKELGRILLERHGYRENLTRVFTKRREHYSHYADDQCCELRDQIGFGLTAFSSLRDRLALNTQDFDEYHASVAAGALPVNRGLVRTPEDQRRWQVILPLKNRAVSKERFHESTGVTLREAFGDELARLEAHGLVEEDDRFLALTEKGRFFANEVCMLFHGPEYLPFPREAYAPGPLSPHHRNASRRRLEC